LRHLIAWAQVLRGSGKGEEHGRRANKAAMPQQFTRPSLHKLRAVCAAPGQI